MVAVDTHHHRYVKIFGREGYPVLEGLMNGTFWNLVQKNLRNHSHSFGNMKIVLSEYLPEAWIPSSQQPLGYNFKFRVGCDDGGGGGFEYGLYKDDDIWIGTENSFMTSPKTRKMLFVAENLDIAFWVLLSKAVLGTVGDPYSLWYKDVKLFMTA